MSADLGLVGGGFVRTWDWDFRISLFLCSLDFFLERVTCLLRSLVTQFVMSRGYLSSPFSNPVCDVGMLIPTTEVLQGLISVGKTF